MADMVSEKRKSRDETEAWILSVLEAEGPLPLDELFDALHYFGRAGSDRRVDGWAELIQDTLVARAEALDVLRILALRCQWRGHDASFKAVCEDVVKRAFTSRLGKVLFKNAGFDNAAISAAESVHRMNVLARLETGVFCADKTWGFGVVKRVDDFYERITIDFDTKRGHEMTMAYAAETLSLVPASHFLVRYHLEKDTIHAMVDSDPAGLVRLVLESYGSLDVDAVKDHLCEKVIPESGWKRFWDAARKALKADPLVHLPPKRSEPIQLLESAESHVDSEFSELGKCREPAAILKKVDALESSGLLDDLKPAHRDLLADRLAFAVWGGEDHEPALALRALLTAERLGLPDEKGRLGERCPDVSAVYAKILAQDALLDILHALPVRLMTAGLERFAGLYPEQTAVRLIEILPALSIAVVQEAIPRIRANGAEDTLGQAIQEWIRQRNAGPSLLFWLLRHPDDATTLAGGDSAELLRQGIDALEWPATGEMLRAQHQLRALYESGEWLGDQLAALTPEQREVFGAKLLSSRGWDETGRRSVLAGIIKRFPELQTLVSTPSDASRIKTRARMTSWRSYRERQTQLQRLMEIEIPENAREIAVARSYGDLRENAEFKYAKEHQRILYRRRDEMELDLEQVKGTDFAGCDCATVGMGTDVTIRRPDGSCQHFRILGEWDRDEALNIISSLSQVAKQLDGSKVGDRVALPAKTGQEMCEIVAIAPLGEDVKAWLAAGV